MARLGDPGGLHDAVVVPDKAVATDQDRKFVYVVSADKKAEYRVVKVGQVTEGQRVILDGLKPGEHVIVNGLMRVRPGQPVSPSLAGADAAKAAAAEPRKPESK